MTDQSFRTVDEVVVQRFDTEVLLVNMNDEAIFTLTGSGVDVFDLMQAGHSTRQIVDALISSTDGGLEEIRSEVGRILEELTAESLIVPRS